MFDFDSPMSKNYLSEHKEVIQLTREAYDRYPRKLLHQADVIIVDGRVIKSRHGKFGTDIEGSLFVWDEVEV